MRFMTLVIAALAIVGLSCSQSKGRSDEGVLRIVSLSPAITEVVHELGAVDTLVGRSDWCDRPESVRRLPGLGSSLSPNMEGIVQVRPTRILVQEHGGDGAESLSQLAPVDRLPWLTKDGIASSIERIGDIVDRKPQARSLAGRFRETLKPLPPKSPARVLAVIGTDGPAGEVFFVRSDSLHGEALAAAGVRNAIPEPPGGVPRITPEQLVAIDPDYVVMMANQAMSPAEVTEAVERWRSLSVLQAVQKERVLVLHGDGLLTTGPKVLELPRAIEKALSADRGIPSE